MNKRSRLIVSLLFIVVIILAIAITRFYFNIPDDPAVNGGGEGIEKIVDTNHDGISIFSDGNGNYGITEAGRIITAPEWDSISFAENDICIASRKINGKVKFGCIDYEGNVIVPLIYSNIEKLLAGNTVMYRAVSEENGSMVLYDNAFVPYFNTPWKSCTTADDEITLTEDKGTYIYTAGNDGLLFKSAVVSGNILNRPYEINISSRVLLSKLNPAMIRKMLENTEAYMKYAYRGDKAFMDGVSTDLRQFMELYPDSEEISAKRLLSIREMHIYSAGSDNGLPLYEVSISADTEIVYTDFFGLTGNLSGVIKSSVKFRGSSEYNIEAISGSFESDSPEYPTEPVSEGNSNVYENNNINENGEE